MKQRLLLVLNELINIITIIFLFIPIFITFLMLIIISLGLDCIVGLVIYFIIWIITGNEHYFKVTYWLFNLFSLAHEKGEQLLKWLIIK